jgi:CDP-diacylglycerol--serine O-phosphatidyltransferase
MDMKQLSLRRFRASHKQKLFLVPYIFTFANALLGFFAIINAIHGKVVLAAYCIAVATLMDMLDGRIARMLGVSSNLGMELDSLCDAVSFCLAPTIIIYSWRASELGMMGIAALAIYLCCGLLRLARFNLTNTQQYFYFSGLPTPIAALLLCSCVINNTALVASPCAVVTYSLGCTVLIVSIAYCMLSTIPFPTFKQYAFNRLSISYISIAAFVVLLGFSHGYPMMFIGIGAYIISSVCMYVYECLNA